MPKRKKAETTSTQTSMQTIVLAGGSSLPRPGKTDTGELAPSRFRQLWRRVRRPVPLPLALLVFGAALVSIFLLDSAFFFVGKFPPLIHRFRDFLLVAGMALLLPSQPPRRKAQRDPRALPRILGHRGHHHSRRHGQGHRQHQRRV